MKFNQESTNIGEMLDVVSEKIPKLIKMLMDNYYSEEAGKQIGRAVGSLYKELLDAGMTKEEAMTLARDYLNTVKEMKNSK